MYSKYQYDTLEKRRKYAWGKYYEQINLELANVPAIIGIIGRNNVNGKLFPDIPNHLTKDYYEMAEELNKKFTCPCCLDLATKDTIAITYCGHIYCKECLDEIKLKLGTCSICRKKL